MTLEELVKGTLYYQIAPDYDGDPIRDEILVLNVCRRFWNSSKKGFTATDVKKYIWSNFRDILETVKTEESLSKIVREMLPVVEAECWGGVSVEEQIQLLEEEKARRFREKEAAEAKNAEL